MYDFWYKNDILFTKIWYTFELIFVIEHEWKRVWNHRWAIAKRREIELVFTQNLLYFLIDFVIETEWKRVWNHRVTTVKLGENDLSFWPFLHQKLYKICGWTRVKTSVKSPRSNSEAVQKLYCFDFNFCKICIVLTIICAFFAQVVYHFWSF